MEFTLALEFTFSSQHTKTANYDLYVAILLASIGTLRRSEVCGLYADDIQGNTVHVHQTMVKNQNYKWVLKSVAKNSTSDRYVEYPDKVIKELPVSGKICNLNPDMITHDFGRTIKKLGLPHFRFHDLRHPYVKPTTKKFITFFEVFRAAS